MKIDSLPLRNALTLVLSFLSISLQGVEILDLPHRLFDKYGPSKITI